MKKEIKAVEVDETVDEVITVAEVTVEEITVVGTVNVHRAIMETKILFSRTPKKILPLNLPRIYVI